MLKCHTCRSKIFGKRGGDSDGQTCFVVCAQNEADIIVDYSD
nr:MAG TPA: hypothetical protein [Caudoviricetes sp.]